MNIVSNLGNYFMEHLENTPRYIVSSLDTFLDLINRPSYNSVNRGRFLT